MGLKGVHRETFLWLALTACSGEISSPKVNASSDLSPETADPTSPTPKVTVTKSQPSADSSTDPNTDSGSGGSTGKVLTGTDTSTSKVTYPEIMLKGEGTTLCDGDLYRTFATAKSRLSDTQFVMQLAAATVRTNSFQSRVQEELDKNLSEVRYTLVPLAERANVDGRDLAIFATASLQVKKDISLNYSNPLPVYIWPAPASRFDGLRTGGPKTWSATVTGKRQFDVSITLIYVSGSGNRTTVRLETHIPQDRNGELYEEFPVPKEAEITVDGDRQIIERSKNENHFFGERSCDDKRGIINLDYKPCTRTVNGTVEDLGCSL